uniref:Apple domain-containing protein n=1 Tax=Haemonchus contortus TaxID=6289 RepID=A0A7I4YN70_HAECO
MWTSKTLAVVVFILQAVQSPSCTITNICWVASNSTGANYTSNSTSLHNCLKTCFLSKTCNYAGFDLKLLQWVLLLETRPKLYCRFRAVQTSIIFAMSP